MSSEANSSDSSSSPTPNEVEDIQIRRLTLLLPLIFRLAARQQNPDDPTPHHPLRVILFNPATGTTILIDRSGDLESLFGGVSRKPRLLPASKDSMEAMPRVVVAEENTDCAICLEDYEIGDEAREMPCKHRFHSGCIEKWLGIHGSCPICRFYMPLAGMDDEIDGGETSETPESSDDLMDAALDHFRGFEYSDPSLP